MQEHSTNLIFIAVMYPYKYIFPRYLQLYKYSQKCKIKTLFRVFVVMGVLSPSHRRDAALPYC